MEGEKYLFVVAGPSGVGKDTVMGYLRQAHPEIEKTVSATTRAPREGEAEGVNYYYRTEEDFKQMIESGDVLDLSSRMVPSPSLSNRTLRVMTSAAPKTPYSSVTARPLTLSRSLRRRVSHAPSAA